MLLSGSGGGGVTIHTYIYKYIYICICICIYIYIYLSLSLSLCVCDFRAHPKGLCMPQQTFAAGAPAHEEKCRGCCPRWGDATLPLVAEPHLGHRADG